MIKLYLKIRGWGLKTYYNYLHHEKVKSYNKFPEFIGYKKIPRYSRECIISEKIDGTNGCILIDENGNIFAGSHKQWLWGSVQEEIHRNNHGFAQWVKANKEELMKLGKGIHYGEFWGQGIQRNYGLTEKRFSLFNVSKWSDDSIRPACCRVVPVLFTGMFTTENIERTLIELKEKGSQAEPNFMKPEGIVIFHIKSGHLYKKTIENDEKPKSVKDE